MARTLLYRRHAPTSSSSFPYLGPQRYFLTQCTFNRHRHFVDAVVVSLVHDQFLRTATEFDFEIHAYCYMPDHLHLFAEGKADSSDLPRFIALAKQRSEHRSRERVVGRLWQKGYFERVLRDDDETFNVARYVVQNPVRAGLVRSPDQYPFTGSSILSREQLIESCMWRPREKRGTA